MSAPAIPSPSDAAPAGAVDGAFVVRLDQFNGPLDLLLHLIREERLDIQDIPVARICDQFVQAIHVLGLNQAADYLDMASRLLRLKAQMLLPRRDGAEDWEDPRAELVRRLLEYQQIKEMALWLQRAADRRAERFPRGWVPAPPEQPPAPLRLDLIDLLTAVERVVRAIPQPVLHRVVARPLDVEAATRRVEALLLEREVFDWREALGPAPTISDVLSTLLAILELARRGHLRVGQSSSFAPLQVRRDAALPAA
ncbi:MAG: ScpA family protein [Gemmatimonadales bacterium]|nr:ScpA family protein [Gemmatimonadales bacterium]